MIRLLTLCCACLLPIFSSAQCPVEPDNEDPLSSWFELHMPGCEDQLEASFRSIEKQLGQPVERMEGESLDDASSRVAWTRLTIGMYRLRLSLRAQESFASTQRYRELAAQLRLMSEDQIELETLHWPRIGDILSGSAAPPDTAKRFSDRPGWLLSVGFCGTPLMSYLYASSALPSAADAWAMRGRYDFAIAEVLENEWIDAMELGLAPPNLRYYVDAMMGPGSYVREAELALKGLRLVQTPAGMIATLPFLGRSLPVPLGHVLNRSLRTEGTTEERTRFEYETVNELSIYLRPILIVELRDQHE